MRQGFHWMQEDMIQKEQFLSEEVYLPRDFVLNAYDSKLSPW
jgi:hypothetical protein